MVYALTALHNFICVYSGEEEEIFKQADPIRTNRSGIQEPPTTARTEAMTINIKRDVIAEYMWVDYQHYVAYQGL